MAVTVGKAAACATDTITVTTKPPLFTEYLYGNC